MRTTAFALALLISGAAMAQTYETTATEVPDVDVGVQPDGDLDVDVDTKTKVTTTEVDGTTSTTTIDDDEATETVATDTVVTDTVATTTFASMTPASGPVVAPSNADPEHDARGIPVISAAAVVPAGWNGVTGTAVGGPLVDPVTGATIDTTDTSYPACTATITDNCMQTYERQGR